MQFVRVCNNPKRMPGNLVNKYLDECQRQDLFNTWMKKGKNMVKVAEIYQRSHEKSQESESLMGHMKERDILKSFGN
jgi:hypothetical protein